MSSPVTSKRSVSPFRPGSKFATSGRRVTLNASPAARDVVCQIALEFGLTRRQVTDAALGDPEQVRTAAARVAARLRESEADGHACSAE
jgi:hypothetical protein